MTRIHLLLLVTAALCMGLVTGRGSSFAADEGKPLPPPKAGAPASPALEDNVSQGALRVQMADGGIVECPLKHTDVQADISGFIANVTVTQTFANPYDDKIEAVYVFPLPHTAAVADMTMVIGERRIVGVVKRRAEARAIYEQALQQGLTASLLEQERPNIFTQSVGNIKPHQEVKIEISYVDVLQYDYGTYEFHFPMVVGPRYIPGAPTAKTPPTPAELTDKVGEVPPAAGAANSQGNGWAPDTDRVPDASRITPPVLRPAFRTGHDISLSVRLDAGVPIQDLKVINHQAATTLQGQRGAAITLDPADSIPNKDFVLRYNVSGKQPEMALLAHGQGSGQGYFMLMIQPKFDESVLTIPRELIFLVDVSGSMSGQPTEKVRQTMREFLKLSREGDTVQVVTFASQANKLFEKPVPATPGNIDKAVNFTDTYRSGGGTEMLKGVQMALDEPLDPQRVRIIMMLTDGFIGNEKEIIEAVGKSAGDKIKFWTLGIGSAPNRFLLDGVAKQGGGMSRVVELGTDPVPLVHEIADRIHRAQLAKINIDWQGLQVGELYPRKITDLWAGSPVILFGRYFTGGAATIQVSGVAEGKPIIFPLRAELPELEPRNDVLPYTWARQKIEDLSLQMSYGDDPAIVEEITQLALDYHLMSQYTSLVAVDESELGTATEPPTPPRRIAIPVPLPDGVSFAGVFGGDGMSVEGDVLFTDAPAGHMAKPGVPPPSPATLTVLAGPAGPQGPQGASGGGYTSLSRFAATEAIHGNIPPLRTSVESGVRAGLQGYVNMPMKAFDARNGRREMAFRTDAVAAGRTRGIRLYGEYLADDFADKDGWAGPGMATLGTPQHREALEKTLAQIKEMSDRSDAFNRAQYAYLLSVGLGGYHMDKAQDTLVTLAGDITAARVKATPALGKTLDLVIRDQALTTALNAVGKAAGLTVTIADGALADAEELGGPSALRLTYLDLRRATVAQALDWLLTPAHLSWRAEKQTITVTSARREKGVTAWVYPVGGLAVPTAKELGDKGQQQKLKTALDNFLEAARVVTGQQGEELLAPGAATWISPNGLLVYGDAATHARVAALLAALKDGKAAVTKVPARKLTDHEINVLVNLQKQTAPRWAARADARAKAQVAQARVNALVAMDQYSWKLLAAAYKQQVDLEALTELQVAWQSPQLAELLKDTADWRPFRSAYALTAAARLLPAQRELQALATKAAAAVLPRAAQAAQTTAPHLPTANVYLQVLYGALLHPAGAEEVRLLTASSYGPEYAPLRTVAASLLRPTAENDAALAKLFTEHQLVGEDLLILAVTAARQRGGAPWLACTQELPTLTAGRGYDSYAVLLANRQAEVQVVKK